MQQKFIEIEVIYPAKAYHTTFSIAVGLTIEHALNQANMYNLFPEIINLNIGIFSKIQLKDTKLDNFDRIEIYTPLIADPKQQRAKRVAKKRKQSQIEKSKWNLKG
jgi:uncharacterized protein